MKSVFMEIINGQAQAYKIYENKNIIAILAKKQINPGHVLIIPKINVDHFSELPEPYFFELQSWSKKISMAIKNATNCIRVGALFAGWDIPHVHYHLIPMHEYSDIDHQTAKLLPEKRMLELQTLLSRELSKVQNNIAIKNEELKQINILLKHLTQIKKCEAIHSRLLL